MVKTLIVEPDRCTGCRTCELVCSLKKEQEFNPARSRIQHITFPKEGLSFPLVCLQCAEPACLKICPSGAIVREGDPSAIIIKQDKCIGCRMCSLACPAGQIILGPKGKAEKCDLCAGDPICVRFCPSGALTYAEPDKNRQQRNIRLAQRLRESMIGFPGSI